jgi:hypothetical protein
MHVVGLGGSQYNTVVLERIAVIVVVAVLCKDLASHAQAFPTFC